MKFAPRLLILFLFVFSSEILSAQRDPGDTLLLKRPRYFGLFVGTLQNVEAAHYLYNEPHTMNLGTQVIKLQVGNAFQGGFFFTYPFLHKMEWDAGFGVFSFQRRTVYEDVTSISTGNDPHILSMHTWIDNKKLVVTDVRSYFSYDLVQRDDYSILFGAGGWLASNRMKTEYNPGSIGIEGNISAYYRYNNKSYVQVHFSPGWMRNGYYFNATIGICYQGERTMRAHPPHYYVRTYDRED
ncbi:MAG TPA: hypothetical protein VFJ43_01625 [Bacteroidia bacterium]|nr:hypothetical protein [Bacteroidia bacterium]